MLDALLALGAICAMFGARYGRRASYVLLISAAIGLALRKLEVPFDIWLWGAVDVAAIAAICWPTKARRKPWRQDWAVLVFFAPLFATYFVPSQAGSNVSVILVALQMVLTLPGDRLAQRWKGTVIHHHSWSDFDLRASHGEA